MGTVQSGAFTSVNPLTPTKKGASAPFLVPAGYDWRDHVAVRKNYRDTMARPPTSDTDMLQIHLSNALVKPFRLHLESEPSIDSSALQWYAHQVIVKGVPCLVLMELQSRYAMVFCGAVAQQVENFPDALQDRLWREVCVITQLDELLPDDDVALLSDIALDLSSSQSYFKGSDRSVMAHISQVVDHLRYLVEDEGLPLPENGADAVSFGLAINEALRKRKGERDYFIPLEVFRDFWLGLIRVVKDKAPKQNAVHTDDNNVISVDFKNRRIHTD